MSENQEQIDNWNGRTGEQWVRYQDELDRVLEPLGLAAMARAQLASGERVFDIGCGCGATTLVLGERVGPSGHVLGVDVSAPMLGRAQARAAAATNITFRESDAAITDFGAPVELVFSRFGVMFFADPVRAFQNLRRAGKRLAFACWGARSENPWASIPALAVAPFLPEGPPPDPFAPGPFAFADRARLAKILTDAGWRDIAIEPTTLPLTWSRSADVAIAVDFFAHIGPAARSLTEATPELRAKALAALGSALTPILGPAGLVLPGAIYLVTATA